MENSDSMKKSLKEPVGVVNYQEIGGLYLPVVNGRFVQCFPSVLIGCFD